MRTPNQIKEGIACTQGHPDWQQMVKYLIQINGQGLLEKFENEAMDAYADQFIGPAMRIAFSCGKIHSVDKKLNNDDFKGMISAFIATKHKVHSKT